jgi:2,3-bisphosphoglycerate-independent phosphoglycerate mutase
VVLVTANASIRIADGILADVAPTILERMGISQPTEMTGKSLVVNQ